MIGEQVLCPGSVNGQGCWQICGSIDGDRLHVRFRIGSGRVGTVETPAAEAVIICPSCGCRFKAATRAIVSQPTRVSTRAAKPVSASPSR